jgi:HK97 family phage portal protein
VGRVQDAYRALTGRTSTLTEFDGAGFRPRASGATSPSITQKTALRNSVWWACLHLRANVFSSFPLDVIKPGGNGLTYPVKNPGILVTEPYPGMDITEFQYSTEMDLGRYGNSIGIIHQRNAFGLASMVELVSMGDVSAKMNGRQIDYWRIGNERFEPSDIWHQKRHTLAGFALGLAPLASAAYSMALYASAQEFALDWFATGATPKGDLRHVERSAIPSEERSAVKAEFKQDTAGGDIFVHGKSWEWTPATQDAMSSGFLSQMSASERDVCRYAGVPASMVDVEVSTGNITYANVTQANLQWLITEIGPQARRSERYWSKNALPKPWQMKLNTDALLRMDPSARADLMVKLKTAGLRVPSELRALDNLPPFTADQLAELDQHSTMTGKATGGKGGADAAVDTGAASAKAQAEIIQKAYLGVGIVITADEARAMINQAGGSLAGSMNTELSREALPWQTPA